MHRVCFTCMPIVCFSLSISILIPIPTIHTQSSTCLPGTGLLYLLFLHCLGMNDWLCVVLSLLWSVFVGFLDQVFARSSDLESMSSLRLMLSLLSSVDAA